MLVPGKDVTLSHCQAAPWLLDHPLFPQEEGWRGLVAQPGSRQLQEATRVAGGAGRTKLQPCSRAGEGDGAQPSCVSSWCPSR